MEISAKQLGQEMYASCKNWAQKPFDPGGSLAKAGKLAPKASEINLQEVTLAFMWVLFHLLHLRNDRKEILEKSTSIMFTAYTQDWNLNKEQERGKIDQRFNDYREASQKNDGGFGFGGVALRVNSNAGTLNLVYGMVLEIDLNQFAITWDDLFDKVKLFD